MTHQDRKVIPEEQSGWSLRPQQRMADEHIRNVALFTRSSSGIALAGAALAATRTGIAFWFAFAWRCGSAVRIRTVYITVAIVIDPIIAIRFRGRRQTAIGRTVAWVLTGIAGSITTSRRRTAIDFAIKTVLITFTDTIAAAVVGF